MRNKAYLDEEKIYWNFNRFAGATYDCYPDDTKLVVSFVKFPSDDVLVDRYFYDVSFNVKGFYDGTDKFFGMASSTYDINVTTEKVILTKKELVELLKEEIKVVEKLKLQNLYSVKLMKKETKEKWDKTFKDIENHELKN